MVVTMLLATTAISTMLTSENAYAYSNSQAKSDINDCGNGKWPLNVGCQNTDSQIQGDDNTAALASQQRFPKEVDVEDVGCPANTQWDITLREPITAFPGGPVTVPSGTILCLPDGLEAQLATCSNLNPNCHNGTDNEVTINVMIEPDMGCPEGWADATATSGNPPSGVRIGDKVCAQ